MKKRVLGCVAAVAMMAAVMTGCNAGAKGEYPSQTVNFIVPYSAGGGTDLIVRALADAAKEDFPKSTSVENKTGGGGSIGMLYGANAKPDGYTVTAVTVELTTLPHTGTGGGLEPEMFKPILMFNSSCSAITVKADAPWNTLDEFLDYAKTNDVQIGNSGIGAIWHLAAAGPAQKAGVDFTYVPFEGSTPAITSLLGGHIDAISVSYSEVIQQVQAGELKVLAVLADEGLPYASEIPTAKELGYDVSTGTWRGLPVPKDTPDEVVGKLYEIFSKAVEKESFKNFMGETNNDIDILNGEEFNKKIAEDYALFGTLIESLGLDKQ